MKEERKKVGLKLNIQKTKIMASSAITSWPIDGKTMETVTDFIFLASKITVHLDCSHEIKRHLLLGRKADKPRQQFQKQKYHFADKGLYIQTYGFSNCHVQMWELDHNQGCCCLVANRAWLFATTWTIACQASLSMGFTRQETGVGCHFLLQGILMT